MKNKTSLQTEIAVGFLSRYSDLHSLFCPRGRIFSNVEERQYFSSGYLNKYVYTSYKSQQPFIRECTVSFFGESGCSEEPLSIQEFLKHGVCILDTLKFQNNSMTTAYP